MTGWVMHTIDTAEHLAEGLAHLARTDRRLRQVIAATGDVPLRRRPPGFAGLARVIVGQQLSVASASAIWERFIVAFPEMTPDAIHRAREPRFRKAGMSTAKIKTLRAVAAACRNGLDLGALATAPAGEAHARLCEVHGIGPWTADIYLLFCLGHPDIFPAGDLALRNAVADAFGLEIPADPAVISQIAAKWTPWRGAAAHLFWAYYAVRRKQKWAPL